MILTLVPMFPILANSAGSNIAGTCELYNASNVKVGTTYSFNDALTEALANNNYTIKLLTDITRDKDIIVEGKNVTFDLDGKWTLSLKIQGLTVRNGGEVKLKDEVPGMAEFNITSYVSVSDGSKATVSNVMRNSNYPVADCAGVYVRGAGSSISISGSVIVTGTENGSISGVEVSNGGTATVNGNIMVEGTGAGGIYGVNIVNTTGTVTVNGNVTAAGTGTGNLYGVRFNKAGGTVHIGGNVTSDCIIKGSAGVYADNGATVSVAGNVSGYEGVQAFGAETSVTVDGNVTGFYSYGIWCGKMDDSSTVTVSGTVTSAKGYILIEHYNRSITNYNSVSSKPGYRQYKSGNCYVWITDRPVVSFTAVQTGGSSSTATSTGIILTFNQAITGLTAGNIIITNGTGEVVKGALSGSGATYAIALSSVATQGDVRVKVLNGTYGVVTSEQIVTVYKSVAGVGPDVAGTCELWFEPWDEKLGTYSFNEALAEAHKSSNRTIKLLTDIKIGTGITVNCKVIFDLDSKWTITIDTGTANTDGLTVNSSEGVVMLKGEIPGTAEFNVSGRYGVRATSYGKAAVSNAKSLSGHAGVYVDNAESFVSVSGNAIADKPGGYGVHVTAGKATVAGNAIGYQRGVYVIGAASSVTVGGDVIALYGGHSSITCGNTSSDACTLTVNGKIIPDDTGAKFFVGGATKYLRIEDATSNKAGYKQYSEGNSYVWVGYREPLIFANSTAYNIPEDIAGRPIDALNINVSDGVGGGFRMEGEYPYTYSITGPSWLKIGHDGKLWGTRPLTPQLPTTAKIEAEDAVGQKASITINVDRVSAPFVFTKLPGFDVPPGIPSTGTNLSIINPSINLRAGVSGGITGPYADPYTFSIVSGPEWLTINPTRGELSGTRPLTEQVATTAKILVADQAGNEAELTINVGEVNTSFSLYFHYDPSYDVPEGNIGTSITPFNVKNAVSGGVEPYKFETGFGANWIVIDENTGELTGTRSPYTNYATTLQIIVRDALSGYADFSINVGGILDPAGSKFTGGHEFDIPAGAVGSPFTTIDLTEGITLPVGATLNSYEFTRVGGANWFEYNMFTGEISMSSGKYPDSPHDATTAHFELRVDHTGSMYADFITIIINVGEVYFPPLNISGATDVPSGAPGSAMAALPALSTSGGTSPYTYSLSGPSWLTINPSTGVVSATGGSRPMERLAATSALIIAQDADGVTSLVVMQVGAVTTDFLSMSNTYSIPVGATGSAVTPFTISGVAGGLGAYVYAVESGPTWLNFNTGTLQVSATGGNRPVSAQAADMLMITVTDDLGDLLYIPISVGAVLNTAVKYSVTVTKGAANKTPAEYSEFETVTVTADAPDPDYVFLMWNATGVTLDNEFKDEVTFVMPDNAVALEAVYVLYVPTYTATVNNGTGSGDFAEGATVTITANAAPAGQRFKNWTSTPAVTFADANKASTTFTMPASAVTVTANYEVATSVSDLQPPDPLRAWTRNGLLHIEGVAPGELLSIFTASGALVYHSVATTPEADIALQEQGLYIIRQGKRTIKVTFEK